LTAGKSGSFRFGLYQQVPIVLRLRTTNRSLYSYLAALLGAKSVADETRAERRARVLRQIFEWGRTPEEGGGQGAASAPEEPEVPSPAGRAKVRVLPRPGGKKPDEVDAELREATLRRLTSLCQEEAPGSATDEAVEGGAPSPMASPAPETGKAAGGPVSESSDTELSEAIPQIPAPLLPAAVAEPDPQLAYRAHHDALTGLPNRPAFEEWMRHGLSYARRYGRSVAVLFIDLDGFKKVNDTFGHVCGDAVLREAGHRFQSALRESDIVARWGGDEFVAGLLEVGNRDDAARAASKLLQAVEGPFLVEGHEVSISASIGISVHPEDGAGLPELIRKADQAMYEGKREGRKGLPMTAEAQRSGSAPPLLIEGQLRHALERQEFRLYYQPQFDLRTGRLHSLEALIRWNHPRLGLMQASTFLPLAERSRHILPISEWALKTACGQIRKLREAGHEVHVGVNISAADFDQEDFAALVERAVEAAGADPQLLQLDFPEGLLVRDLAASEEKLKGLRRMGIGVCVDDFGSSYGSLEYVQRLHVDGLKLDSELIRRLQGEERGPILVRSLITLAKSAGARANAEGVETRHELEVLKEAGCDCAQGFLLGMPAPAEEIFTKGNLPTLAV